MDARPPSYTEAKTQLSRLSRPVLRKLCYIATNHTVQKETEAVEELARMVSVIAETPRRPMVIPAVHLGEGRVFGKQKCGVYMYALNNQHICPEYTRKEILERYHEKQGEEEDYNVRIVSNRVCVQIGNYALGAKEYARSRETLHIHKLMVGKVSFPRTYALHSGMQQRFGRKYHPAGYSHMICMAVFDPARVEDQDGPGVEKMALRVEADAHEFCRKELGELYDIALSTASTGGMVKANHDKRLYMVYLAVKTARPRRKKGEREGVKWRKMWLTVVCGVVVVSLVSLVLFIKAIG